MGDFQKRRQSWHTFFKVMVEIQCFLDSSHVRVPYGPDETNQRHWGFQWSRQECQKRPNKGQKSKKGDFQRRRQSWHTFSMVLGETQVVLDSSHVRVTYETNQRQKGPKRSRQERPKLPKNGSKTAQKAKKGDFQRRRQSWHTFFMVMRDIQCVLYSSHIRVPLDLMKPIRDNEDHISLRKVHQDFCVFF